MDKNIAMGYLLLFGGEYIEKIKGFWKGKRIYRKVKK